MSDYWKPLWDENDELLIKGLIIWGPNSPIWKKAPKECQDKALELMKSWTPPDHSIPEALACDLVEW